MGGRIRVSTGKDVCLPPETPALSPLSLPVQGERMLDPFYWCELSETPAQEQSKRVNRARFHHICPIPGCFFDCVRRDYYIRHLAEQHGIMGGINTTTVHYCRWFAFPLPLSHNPGSEGECGL